METQWREPIQFVAGDSLIFQRSLAQYPPSAGWSLLYELRGVAQPISFASTPSGNVHQINVASAVTAQWLPGDYVLTGFAILAAGERHQIYYGDLPIYADATQAPGIGDMRTHAQKMVDLLESVMLAKAGDDLAASSIGETHFKYLTPAELRLEHGYWKSVRQQEIARERAKAGLPTGNKIRPVMRVKSPGVSVGMFGYGGFPQ